MRVVPQLRSRGRVSKCSKTSASAQPRTMPRIRPTIASARVDNANGLALDAASVAGFRTSSPVGLLALLAAFWSKS